MDDVQRQRTNVLYAHLHDVRRSFVRLKRNIYRYGISEALLILNEKKKRKNSAEEKRPRKRPKYLPKGQTWRFAEKMREVPLQIRFLSKKKNGPQNEKKCLTACPSKQQTQEGSSVLFCCFSHGFEPSSFDTKKREGENEKRRYDDEIRRASERERISCVFVLLLCARSHFCLVSLQSS